MPAKRRRVALFVTCLVDLFRPTVGFAAAALLERAGCEVVVPAAQTCCGQPAYNSGAQAHAKAIARAAIAAFEPFEATVAPSGSCAGMIRRHYPAIRIGASARTFGRAIAARRRRPFSPPPCQGGGQEGGPHSRTPSGHRPRGEGDRAFG